ncbi:MAG: serine/threonine protein kinase [Kiritimatiellae bacterium]|nr:serine/threonine protein kinase [Kiritimatiellia bacterium]
MGDDSISAMCAAHGPVASACRFSIGTIFGDWRLTAFIGRGGNGEVYCAEHVALGTSAAVKVLVRDEPRAKERFVREAKLLSELKSTSFPQFYSYGEANGCPYLAMELLEPGELPSGDRNVARFLLSICDAVAELHSRGYIHRDIKPSNILRRTVGSRVPRDCGRASLPSIPVLADLGLAREIVLPSAELQTSNIRLQTLTLGGVGTPGYGAPEQMERGEATVASDIHALGVLADACFGGNPPRTWARIIRRATSSIPAHRYPSVAGFARAIRWRNLWMYATGLTVVLLAIAAMSNVDLRNLKLLDELLASSQEHKTANLQTNEVMHLLMPPSGPSLAESVRKLNEASRGSWERYRELFPTNMPVATVMRLNGEKVALPEPVVLEGGKEYRIFGPGTLDADLFCPTTTIVRLKDCVLVNRTKRLYPENGIRYRLDNGVYLNFVNVKRKPLSLTLGDFLGIYDGAYNQVRFGGPETVKELMEQINEERSIEIQSMEP